MLNWLLQLKTATFHQEAKGINECYIFDCLNRGYPYEKDALLPVRKAYGKTTTKSGVEGKFIKQTFYEPSGSK